MDSPSPQPEEQSGPVAGSPSDFLKNIVGKKVKVRIGSGVDYHGRCFLIADLCRGKDGWRKGMTFERIGR